MGLVCEYVHLSGDGQAKTGPGILHTVVVTGGASANAVAEIYDSTTTSNAIATVKALQQETVCAVLDVAFGVGVYVDLTGSGAEITLTFA